MTTERAEHLERELDNAVGRKMDDEEREIVKNIIEMVKHLTKHEELLITIASEGMLDTPNIHGAKIELYNLMLGRIHILEEQVQKLTNTFYDKEGNV